MGLKLKEAKIMNRYDERVRRVLSWWRVRAVYKTLAQGLVVSLVTVQIVLLKTTGQTIGFKTGWKRRGSGFSSKPIALVLVPTTGNVERIALEPSDMEHPRRFEIVQKKNVKKVSGEHMFKDGCEQMYDWQTIFYPTCNNIHETGWSLLQPGRLRQIAAGNSRDVFELNLWDGTRWALKTHQFNLYFSEDHLRGQINDAVIAERASFSKYVANMYGVCGFSSLYEFAQEGTLAEHYRHLDRGGRLRAAVQVARGLADVHALGGDDYAPFAHHDISDRRFVKLHGRFQLTGFNYSFMIGRDKRRHLPCKVRIKKHVSENRAPEEFRDFRNEINEKVDVYSVGNIFYQLLMGEHKYKGKKETDAARMILAGDIPTLPDYLEQSKDVVIVALKTAMHMSFVLDPEWRASAKQVAEYLEGQLEKFNNESSSSTIR